MTKRDDLRHLLVELSLRGVQVFVAALLVELIDGELLAKATAAEGFWRECATAAIIAVISQALTLAAYQLGHRHRQG